MRVFLIRHAHAGDPLPGTRDLYRPLTARGRDRAKQLAELLAGAGIERIITSPASRCLQTVEPLATGLAVESEEQPDLWEGSAIPHVLALIEQQTVEVAAVCTHGDIIPAVIETLAERGAVVTGRGCETGSIWILEHDGRAWTSARYVAPSQAALPQGVG